MAANEITICNMALYNLGQRRTLTSSDGTVANVTTEGPAADACVAFYDNARDSVLRAFPWSFARKRANLGAPADDGTGEVWEDQWDNAYTYPADCLQLLHFQEGTGPVLTDDPTPYEIGLHNGSKVIFSDVAEADADVVYTARVETTTDFPEDFTAALAWRLAADLAMPLTSKPEVRQAMMREYMLVLTQAQRMSANESMPDDEADGEFVREREG